MRHRLHFSFLLAPLFLAVSWAHAQTEPPALDLLRARFQNLESRLARKEIPLDPRNVVPLRLCLEQASLWLQSVDSNQAPAILSEPYSEVKEKLSQVLYRADLIAAARTEAVYAPAPQVRERAYIANNDGSVQPYWVFLPRGYTPQRKWPLVVFLHGYDPDLSKINPWIPSEATWSLFTTRGFILAIPYGRRNSDFVNVGEDDTLAVTEEVSTRYNVDRARTFLMGASMGGYGVYAVGLHHPERFAALATMCARSDMYLWFRLDRELEPSWKQVFYDGDGPRQIIGNAFQLPLFLQHGSDDQVVSVENSRLFAADAARLRLPTFYREIPEGSHYIYFDETNYETALDWFSKLRPQPVPSRVVYSTGSLRNNRAYWVRIEGFEHYDRLARIEVQIKADNHIEVTTDNVSRFALTPPAEYLTADKPVTLVLNGIAQTTSFVAPQPLHWPVETPITQHKTPTRCGPIRECYRDPFLVVFGTLQAGGEDEAKARRFVQEWERFADGRPPLKADKDVTLEDKQAYNLILFGTPATNALLSEANERLPLAVTSQGYRLGTTEYLAPAGKYGVQFCYPSPWSEQRMIVVQSGLYWGEALPLNHKFDLLPEFIVYTDEITPSDQTNVAITAGYFDDMWQSNSMPKLPREQAAP